MFRKFLIILTCILAVCTAATSQNVGNAIGEKIVETVLGKNIEINGDSVTVAHDDGAKYVYGTGKWPGITIAKLIPRVGAGVVRQTLYTKDTCVITVTGVREDYFDSYIRQVNAAGFKYTPDMSGGNTERCFSAKSFTGNTLNVTYYTDNGTLSIYFSIAKKPENLTSLENTI
jgi:hypothetical protein